MNVKEGMSDHIHRLLLGVLRRIWTCSFMASPQNRSMDSLPGVGRKGVACLSKEVLTSHPQICASPLSCGKLKHTYDSTVFGM